MNDVSDNTEDLPREFGDYQLLRCLGRGGMGKVYLAKIKAKGLVGVDKLCVVKTLRVSHDPEYQRRFVDEARLIVLLTHRNICHVFDAGCFEDQYYLAMEHINGRELRQVQVMAEETKMGLPVDVAIFVVKEVLEALDAAHRMKHPLTGEPLRVVHRDVSPQNVMLSSEGEVKLIDFGLAESTQKLERTAPRIVMGKIAYMAPEQARGETVDGRADQFAAGVLLYELLANERYYGDLPFDDVWRSSGRGGFQPTRLMTMEPGLIEVIQKSTAPRRDDRYESCGDMRAALQQVELKRGALAGSREVRTAFQELLSLSGESMPSASSAEIKAIPRPAPSLDPRPVPPPAAVAAAAVEVPRTPPTISPPGREKTRTFRIRSTLAGESEIQDLAPHEKTEIGFVIEGLVASELPPALSTGDAFRPLSLLASAPSLPAPARTPSPDPKTAPRPPREATVVVRTRSAGPQGSSSTLIAETTEVRTVPGMAGAPDTLIEGEALGKPKGLYIAAAAAAVALVVVVVAVLAGGGEATAVVDAGPAVAIRSVPVVDAGTAAVLVVPDAGVVVDARVVVDAGADPDLADLDEVGPRPVRPAKPKRNVADFPADKSGGEGALNLINRTTHLKAFCADVACYSGVTTEQNRSPRPGEDPEARRKALRRLQNQCLRTCRGTPRL
ncbi:MAG: protein kinase [Deltaproteobacteria bacterium]|nr:protein kinase [Deltaproteobacteria bacterium]